MIEIILNPNGACGQAGKVWDRIEPQFVHSQKPYRVHISHGEDDIPHLASTLSNQPCDIVVVGGDGSFNQAVNGIVDYEHVRMGLIPAGSGNDLVRGLGVDHDPSVLAETILKGNTVRKMDVGEVVYYDRCHETRREPVQQDGFVHHRFVISAGIGFDGQICHDAETSRYKKILNQIHMGRLIYLLTAIHTITSTERTRAWIKVDGKTMSYDRLLLCVVMNHPYEGGGFMFCPSADGNDGILDGCIANGLSQYDFFRIFPYALKGNHLKFQGVHPFSAHEVEITTEKPLWVHTDGETACCSNHIAVRLLKKQIQMLL